MNLEEVLNYLTAHGNPSLMRLKDGQWFCRLDLFVPGTGFSAEVKGDWHSQTALESAQSCKDRLDALLQSMAEARPTIGNRGAA